MNYLNIFIFIIATFFLIIEAFPGVYKVNEWKKTNPKRKKIEDLGKEAIKVYNKKHGPSALFNRVLKAEKQYNGYSKNYHLQILVLGKCDENTAGCLQTLDADIFKKHQNPDEPEFYVYKNSDENGINLE
uniref:Cystatin domain-containing protein n=1 Tax=Strongyloides papillosus TaxID=174720 RepID=A0A0N5B733_STREA